MAAKYFVWGEGVWREVDLASGRVSGWRHRARFVFVRRGRLLVARRRPVLRALEALAVGQPSAAADGPRLSHRRKSECRTKRKHEPPDMPAGPPVPDVANERPMAPPVCEHHHCCARRCDNSEQRAAGVRNTGTQCALPGAGPRALTFSVKQQHCTSAAPHYSSGEEFASTSTQPLLAARRTTEVNELFGKKPATKSPAATLPADKSADERQELATKRPRTVVSADTDSTSADEPLQRACKELVISDADVALLRGYVSRTNASALQRFDVDDAYKRLLFYAINPLVQLERCERLERLQPTRRPGPAPARPRARSSSADTDKENKDKHSSPNKVREPAASAAHKRAVPPSGASAARLGVSERSNKLDKERAVIKAPEINGFASDSSRAKLQRIKKTTHVARVAGACSEAPRGTHVISKRATQPGAKEYSNLEDHAIVAWLSSGSRACLVSGNRVWRDLQDEYERLTGRARSWHSLRNRYLRYILPALGALQLPPADVSRLRAAAATGAIKTKNRLARRHSAFQTPVRGASWRPRPGADRSPTPAGASSGPAPAAADGDADGPSSPKRRSLRPRPPESASKDTSYKDDSSDESAIKAPGSKDGSGAASVSKESASKAARQAAGSKVATGQECSTAGSRPLRKAARSPRYSEVTRRFAARHRAASSSPSPSRSSSSPSPAQAPSPAQSSRSPSPVLGPSSRSRRLFNPNSNV